MKLISDFVRSALGGAMIAVGGVVFLSVENPVVGAILFSVGLLSILNFELYLYTGKVGYLLTTVKPGTLALIWLGNLAGTWVVGMMVRGTRIWAGFAPRLEKLVAVRREDSWASLVILGVFCGILMFVAVDLFRRDRAVGWPVVILCVTVFICCGFEHCVADMAYFSLAGAWDGDLLLRTLAITLGNSLGGLLLPAAAMLRERGEKG